MTLLVRTLQVGVLKVEKLSQRQDLLFERVMSASTAVAPVGFRWMMSTGTKDPRSSSSKGSSSTR